MKFCAAAVTVLVILAVPAEAGIITFTGQDDGAAIGSGYTNSNAAQASFLAAAAAFGTVETHNAAGGGTFGSSSGTFADGNGTWTTTQPTGCCTNGYSGVSNITFGNLYGFNISHHDGSGDWLGFPAGTATYNLTYPTNSFGFFATGIQSVFGNVFTVSFFDGANEVLNVPINVNGGIEYFGFTDTSAFTAIIISRPAGADGNWDYWGNEGVSFDVSQTPLPAALPLYGAGLGLMGLLGWRRRRKAAAKVVA
jgi:hypothetical protein